MTENKRFVPDEQGFVYDIETMGYVPDIFKLLNELNDENEQLNSQLNRLSDELFCEDCHTCRHSESINITVKCGNGEGVTTYHSGCDFYEIDERFIEYE